MKWSFLLLFCLLFTSGCDIREREQQLEQREAAVNQREQELVLKGKELQLKEEELLKREQQLDSSHLMAQSDSSTYNPDLIGLWNVKMNCTETTCTGSAVGDTKTEQWDIAYQNKNIIAKVIDNGKLVRIYSGTYNGTSMELSVQQNETAAQTTTMTVRLQQTVKGRFEGRREIVRGEECRIVYAMEVVKQ